MNGVSPNWATEEVDKRVPPPPPTSTPTAATDAWQWKTYADHLRHFAAILIAKHEKEPIDPLMEAARELVAKYHEHAGRYAAAVNTREGKWDHTGAALVYGRPR